MTSKNPSPTLYTIPAGVGFADIFAATLLQQNRDNPEKLAETLILLPTRRACRIVREAFLRQSGGIALLLPRMQTLGDVDEDSLSLEMAALNDVAEASLNIPPALSPLRRRMILMRLILQREAAAQKAKGTNEAYPPDQALALADALGELMDRIQTEGLDMAALPSLVDGDFAEHWQITVDFLSIISTQWPVILEAYGCIDAAERRNLLLQTLARHWEANPPQHRVIAAGSTGSIPASGDLLRVIASLPDGSVILPGLDQDMDAASWDAIDETHPQASLKDLLHKMGVGRDDVKPWPVIGGTVATTPRNKLATEIMRPAATTEQWRSLAKNAADIAEGLNHIQRFDCATAQEEARLISLIFRHVQHQPGKTAALVTFDRELARRVAASCARFDVQVDDTAGIPLGATRIGSFLSLVAESWASEMAPIPLLSLLKHSHAAAGMDHGAYRQAVRKLDRVLRGPRPGPGIDGLRAHVMAEHDELLPLIDRIEACFKPLLDITPGEYHPFLKILTAHIQVAEALASTTEHAGGERLWMGDEGEDAALFLSDLRDHSGGSSGSLDGMPDIGVHHYSPMLDVLMRGISVRPAYGAHPRLMIMGPLESRLIQADYVILGGLNEGSWPPAPKTDPWMSRPMRNSFGLPGPDRDIGLSAHDFVQCLCTHTAILTRAERAGTAPTIPSRWLQRLDTVLQAAGLNLAKSDWLDQVRTLDEPIDSLTFPRPAPMPSVQDRPIKLSVTEIETWMRDPYAVYAKHVLSLRKLDPVDQKPDAADRGTILHDTLEQFTKAYPHTVPHTAYDDLLSMGHTRLYEQVADAKTRHFWGVRFDQAASWFFPHEVQWRTQANPVATEVKGDLTLPNMPFTLTAKADRIDRMKDGSGLAIIDYKTGTHPTEKQIISGLSPQLSLEAAMAMEGVFPGVPGEKPAQLSYWKLSGGRGGGKATTLKSDPNDLAEKALLGLENLVRVFANENTHYLSLPRPAFRPKYQDYAHLARVQEWSVLEDSDEGGEA